MGSSLKVGVYVDVENIRRNGGMGMRFDVLRQFAARDGAEVIRLNAYLGHDRRRAEKDPDYQRKVGDFYARIREFGYKVCQKEVKWFRTDENELVSKANADLDLAVDLLIQSEKLDRVMLVSGDGDFVRVVRAAQNRGSRVEVVAFDNVSHDLREEADMFISGYLVPNLLLPSTNQLDSPPAWGLAGSRVRGTCYSYKAQKGYGFLRVLKDMSGPLWNTDPRAPSSPYLSVFFHISSLREPFPAEQLPSYQQVFEFTLLPTDRGDGGFQAVEMIPMGRRSRPPLRTDEQPPVEGVVVEEEGQ